MQNNKLPLELEENSNVSVISATFIIMRYYIFIFAIENGKSRHETGHMAAFLNCDVKRRLIF